MDDLAIFQAQDKNPALSRLRKLHLRLNPYVTK
jgi:hypothetical protein